MFWTPATLVRKDFRRTIRSGVSYTGFKVQNVANELLWIIFVGDLFLLLAVLGLLFGTSCATGRRLRASLTMEEGCTRKE